MPGGEAALIVSGLQQELGQPVHHLYAIHDNTVYRLTLVPADREMPSPAGKDLEVVEMPAITDCYQTDHSQNRV